MPRRWRWALSLGLAFLSGVPAALVACFWELPQSVSVPMVVAAGVLALAAGYVLSTWRTTLVLVVAAAIGAGATIWASIVSTPSIYPHPETGIEGPRVMDVLFFWSVWFVIFLLAPLTVGLFIGNAIGWWRRVGTV